MSVGRGTVIAMRRATSKPWAGSSKASSATDRGVTASAREVRSTATGEVSTTTAATTTVSFTGTGDEGCPYDRYSSQHPDQKSRTFCCHHGFHSVAGWRFTGAPAR